MPKKNTYPQHDVPPFSPYDFRRLKKSAPPRPLLNLGFSRAVKSDQEVTLLIHNQFCHQGEFTLLRKHPQKRSKKICPQPIEILSIIIYIYIYCPFKPLYIYIPLYAQESEFFSKIQLTFLQNHPLSGRSGGPRWRTANCAVPLHNSWILKHILCATFTRLGTPTEWVKVKIRTFWPMIMHILIGVMTPPPQAEEQSGGPEWRSKIGPQWHRNYAK